MPQTTPTVTYLCSARDAVTDSWMSRAVQEIRMKVLHLFYTHCGSKPCLLFGSTVRRMIRTQHFRDQEQKIQNWDRRCFLPTHADVDIAFQDHKSLLEFQEALLETFGDDCYHVMTRSLNSISYNHCVQVRIKLNIPETFLPGTYLKVDLVNREHLVSDYVENSLAITQNKDLTLTNFEFCSLFMKIHNPPPPESILKMRYISHVVDNLQSIRFQFTPMIPTFNQFLCHVCTKPTCFEEVVEERKLEAYTLKYAKYVEKIIRRSAKFKRNGVCSLKDPLQVFHIETRVHWNMESHTKLLVMTPKTQSQFVPFPEDLVDLKIVC
jgi:hypothetical protein